jgi:hypothetical protein
VDLRTGRMEGFVRWSRDSKAKSEASSLKAGSYPVYRTVARLNKTEIADLARLAYKSSLHDFVPKNSDVRARRAALDECPPTLVIYWKDKRREFGLPLNNTVRPDLIGSRRRAYDGMDKITGFLLKLQESYDKKPYVSAVAVRGTEYKRFEKERDKR